MTTSFTPLGLFASCTVGKISAETNIIFESSECFKRFTQFDMQFWVSLLQEFAKRNVVRQHLT